MKTGSLSCLCLAACLLSFTGTGFLHAENPVASPDPSPAPSSPSLLTIRVGEVSPDISLPDGFLGLSYESSILLPGERGHYFDATNAPLVTLFRTLGIRNLRIGANAVDDPRVAVPDEKDIDALFGFAKAADVKVIYSFRLKNGDPENSARLARHIHGHYGDLLDCLAVGNEPDCFEGIKGNKEGYGRFYSLWKPHYDAILKAVPTARIEGPSAAFNGSFALNLAKDLHAGGHLPMVSTHHYVFGPGAKAELDPSGTRERFLSETNAARYGEKYLSLVKPLADMGVPYRIDEMNSCYNGGAKGSSDTYASALWALDWDHWWASRGIVGVNYHTGESVGMNGGFHAPNYASFVHLPGGSGFDIQPIAYSHLAFSKGAGGRILEARSDIPTKVSSYAYRNGSESLVTLINREHAPGSLPQRIRLLLPKQRNKEGLEGTWERLDLVQKSSDVAAKSEITLGGEPITPEGSWNGTWRAIGNGPLSEITLEVPPASATILRWHPKT